MNFECKEILIIKKYQNIFTEFDNKETIIIKVKKKILFKNT